MNEITECIIIHCKQQENMITVNYNKKDLGKNSSSEFCLSCLTRSRAAFQFSFWPFPHVTELPLQDHAAYLHFKRKKMMGRNKPSFFHLTRNTKDFPEFPLRRIIPVSHWPELCHVTWPLLKIKKYWEAYCFLAHVIEPHKEKGC